MEVLNVAELRQLMVRINLPIVVISYWNFTNTTHCMGAGIANEGEKMTRMLRVRRAGFLKQT